MTTVESLARRLYPDQRKDGTRMFYEWLRTAVTPSSVALNVGAGAATGDARRSLRGECRRIVGVDVDPAVLDNDELDERLVTNGVDLPFESETFDVAWADYVFEHLATPEPLLREVARVLRPGGSFFFRTPNVAHYLVLASRLTSHATHARFLTRVLGAAPETRTYPTYYRLNGRGRLRRLGRRAGFSGLELRMVEGEPVYLRFHVAAFLAGVAYERVVDRLPWLAGLRVNILGRLVR